MCRIASLVGAGVVPVRAGWKPCLVQPFPDLVDLSRSGP